jgi:hypothetical protein
MGTIVGSVPTPRTHVFGAHFGRERRILGFVILQRVKGVEESRVSCLRQCSAVRQLLDVTDSQKDVAPANTFEDLFYITTLEQATPEAILTDSIWYVAGKEGMHRLID